jgi:hypothetical protein
LLHNSTVTELFLGVPYLFGVEYIRNLASRQCPFLEYLSTSQHLREVIVDAAPVVTRHSVELCEPVLRAIGENPRIQYLCCSQFVSLQPMADVMARTTSITILSIVLPLLGDTVDFAVDALSSNTTLTELRLIRGSDAVFDAILEQLEGHALLSKLSLNTKVFPSGVCDLLESNTNISKMDLEVDENIPNSLFRAIRANSTLLEVQWNDGQPPPPQIQTYLERNQQMRSWFASEESLQESLATKVYWSAILPSLFAATRPVRSTTTLTSTAATQANGPPPNAILAALLQVRNIGSD